MKNVYLAGLLLFSAAFILPVGGRTERPRSPPPAISSARKSAPGPAPEPAPVSPFYSGDGGKGMSIAILAPKAPGLAENQGYIPALVQGELVSNFSGYSALSVMDRENLDTVYGELLSGYYDEQDAAGFDLGHLKATDYILSGTITRTAAGYAMQLQIAKTADKMTAASYSGTCSIAELDSLTGVRRASLELLEKIGVLPTERAREELAAPAAANHVSAQTALAQGIAAERKGTEIAALSYYYQAAAFDPSLLEAANRASVMTANISSGNIGADARNDIQWRKDWIARLTEAEGYFDNFFKTSSPPLELRYETALDQGKVNYQTETLPMSFQVNLYAPSIWFTSVERAVRAAAAGLNATNRKETWGLGGWPLRSVTGLNPFRDGQKSIAAVFELVNDKNQVIGRQTVTLTARWSFSISGDVRVSYSANDLKRVHFDAVKAADITDTLTIRAASINGRDPQTAARQDSLLITSVPGGQNDNVNIDDTGVVKGFIDKSKARPDLVISETHLTGPQITAIGERAFEKNQLTSVTIPNSVTSIGDFAFGNNRLTSVSIPNSLTSIGNSAFGNNQLTSVSIPSSVTSIGAAAFAYNQLTSVTIPNSLTSIGNSAFSENQLTSVTILNGVTSIGQGAFASNRLTSITIPNSLTSIGEYAFASNRLTSVFIPNSVTSIGKSAFARNQLTSVTIGAGVDLSSSRKDASFGDDFETAYNRNGQKAGTYTRPDTKSNKWSFTPR